MIDFDDVIRDLKGVPIKPDNDQPMTIGSCSVAALQHLYPNEDVTPEVKVKRFKLALKITQADQPIALSNDEVSTLKVVVGKFWNPLVLGRIYEAIDPEGMKTS